MEYELSDAGTCRKRLVLKFSTEEVNKAFEESYNEINGYVQLKGFRKGKAPRRTLEKRFAKEAVAGAKQQLIEKPLADIVKDEKLQLLGPFMEPDNPGDPVSGQTYEISVEVDVAPEFELPVYKGLEIKQFPVEITDEKVDGAIDRYRKAFTTYQVVSEPAREDDVLLVDFISKAEGQEIINMVDQRLRVEGDILFGLPCPDLVATFTGAEAGQTKTLTITLPDDHPTVELRGKPATVEVTVKSVERGEMPELNDEFAANVGMNTLAEMRDRVRRNLINEAMIDSKIQEEEEMTKALTDLADFELPMNLVDNETNALVMQRRNQLLRSGAVEDEALEKQLDSYRPQAAEIATRQIRWGILAKKIADKENITVTPEEVQQQVESLASSYQTTPTKILQHIRKMGGLDPMIDEILSLKVVNFIRENSKNPTGGDTESVNTAAADSVAKAESETAGEGEA